MSWQPRHWEEIATTQRDRDRYMLGDPESGYSGFKWPYPRGIHKRGREFPVAVVWKSYVERGYECYLSAQEVRGDLDVHTYLLERMPGKRRQGDSGYKKMVDEFGMDRINRLHELAASARADQGRVRHGGDPDLFVQNPKDPADRFFVEVKLEVLTRPRPYRDRLNGNQLILFPLIESVLECYVRVATVSIQE